MLGEDGRPSGAAQAEHVQHPVRAFAGSPLGGEAMSAPSNSGIHAAWRPPRAPNLLGGATAATARHLGPLGSRARPGRPVQPGPKDPGH
eukprot:10839851-Alexandrium_andersonii.AAC.1